MRPARPEEAAALSALALRSKAQWGYDDEFMEACRADLTLSSTRIAAGHVVVAEEGGAVVGFYTLDGVPPLGELGNLWIEPAHLRRGAGRRLWRDAVESARELGFTAILIDADPHAEGFYLAMGAVRIGEVASSAIPGRVLPRLRFDLAT